MAAVWGIEGTFKILDNKILHKSTKMYFVCLFCVPQSVAQDIWGHNIYDAASVHLSNAKFDLNCSSAIM